MCKFKPIGLAAVLLFAAAAQGCAAQTPAAPTPSTQASSTRTIETAGHKLAYHVIPGHAPAIVLDSGGGEDSSHWSSLAPEIARRTGSKVITYDRAGMGESEAVPGPWQVGAAVDDLEAVLKAAGATHDVILVSHSLAGEIATYTAIRHPDWLRGVVMVDANVPPFFTDEVIAEQYAAWKPHIDELAKQPSTPQSRQLLQLFPSFVETSRAFHRAVWPKSVPSIVIVSEKTPFGPGPAGEQWKAAQAAFAGEAPNRRLVEATGSSHDIVHDRPDVVIQAILDFVGR